MVGNIFFWISLLLMVLLFHVGPNVGVASAAARTVSSAKVFDANTEEFQSNDQPISEGNTFRKHKDIRVLYCTS